MSISITYIPRRRLAMAAVLSLAASALTQADTANPPVTVQLEAPGHYIDIGTGIERQRHIATLEKHLKAQGAQCLRDGEKLELTVFNVDLAGFNEWWHSPGQDLRVMRDATWPRVDLRYVWRDAQGNVLREGRQWIADMNYLSRTNARNDRDPLPYEKAMLRDWFARTLCKGEQQQAAK